jgi:hypothetical protein
MANKPPATMLIPQSGSQQTPSTWANGGTSIKPVEDRAGHPLVGCCFIVRSVEGATQAQGVIRAIVPSGAAKGELALVQYFEAGWDTPNTMALVPLADMQAEPIGNFGGWVLFEDSEHLQDYFEEHQGARDRRVGDER